MLAECPIRPTGVSMLAAAFTRRLPGCQDWSAAELKQLNSPRSQNAARASACLALGQIQSEASRAVVRSVIKEAAVKLNGMADSATIEACLAAFGRLGMPMRVRH